MSTWIERMNVEIEELDGKIDRAHVYLESHKDALLQVQVLTMIAYREVLSIRIDQANGT